MAKSKAGKDGEGDRRRSSTPVAGEGQDERKVPRPSRGLPLVFVSLILIGGVCYCYLDHISTTADDIASMVLGPELRAALIEGWNYAANEMRGIAAYLPIVGEQPHPENVADTVQPEPAKKMPKKQYAKANITNSSDKRIRNELDDADGLLEKGDVNTAMTQFDNVLSRYPRSPRAQFGKAQALNALAEKRQSNTILEQAIDECLKVLTLDDVPQELFIKAGTLCADRQSFRGFSRKAVSTLKSVADRYPSELRVWNELGVKCLLAGQQEEARKAFSEVLKQEPKNGFALVHLGFIVKTSDRDYAAAIPLLQEGISSNVPGVIDGRFFFHLGDALYRTGQHDEAHRVYERGASLGLFRSAWQRSLYNVERLKSWPWWNIEQTRSTDNFRLLESHWKEIRDEGLANLNEKGLFEVEAEDLRDTGDWKQFTLYTQGRKNAASCRRAPRTCELVEKFTEATSCKRGQIKFSVMHPVVHVWPHTGPTNCRIRAHLGLVVPPGPRIRVANDTREWIEGKFIIFDDSFEHEVWHDGNSLRLVLIIDIWHPDLTAHEKATLTPI